MPFDLSDLPDWRKLSRDYVVSKLPVRSVILPRSPLAILTDNNAGLAWQVQLYIQWLSRQFLPDTAETTWLDRHASIWLPNSGRKAATFATGTGTITGIVGNLLPMGSQVVAASGSGSLLFETTVDTTIGSGPTNVGIRALDAGSQGNLPAGATLGLSVAYQGIDSGLTVVSLSGGADQETDDELRVRVLARIQKPPMGGDADDYVAWALEVPGVTRAWCSPLEMGMGTVTVRFMMDDLRATNDPLTDGFPLSQDVAAVQEHMDVRRPVAVKDFFVVAPVPEPISYTVHLSPDSAALRAASKASVAAMLSLVAKPAFALNGIGQDAQMIPAAWVSDAILNTPEINYPDLTMADHIMPTKGSLAVIGTPTYA